jgi:hypothetical protein
MPMATALRCTVSTTSMSSRLDASRDGGGDASQDRPSQLHAERRDHGCGRAIQSSTLQILCRLSAQLDGRCYTAAAASLRQTGARGP